MQVPSQIRNENVNECDPVCESSTTECIQEHEANFQTDQSGNIQRSKEEDSSISGLREYSRKLPPKSWQRPSQCRPVHYEPKETLRMMMVLQRIHTPGNAVRPSVMKASEIGVTQMLGTNG